MCVVSRNSILLASINIYVSDISLLAIVNPCFLYSVYILEKVLVCEISQTKGSWNCWNRKDAYVLLRAAILRVISNICVRSREIVSTRLAICSHDITNEYRYL